MRSVYRYTILSTLRHLCTCFWRGDHYADHAHTCQFAIKARAASEADMRHNSAVDRKVQEHLRNGTYSPLAVRWIKEHYGDHHGDLSNAINYLIRIRNQ